MPERGHVVGASGDDLVAAFDELPPDAGHARKLDVLLRLDRVARPVNLVEFWTRVLVNAHQPTDLRSEVLRRLRAVSVSLPEYRAISQCIIGIAEADPDAQLRLQATAALGDFANDAHVTAALGRILADPSAPFEQRYLALTSLQRGGPLPSSLILMDTIVGDEELGRTAHAVLSRWRARLRRESCRPH